MTNELEKEAKKLWANYTPKENFWRAYHQLIKIAKSQNQPVDLAPYQERQHLAFQNLSEASHYNLKVTAPTNFNKIFTNSLIIPSIITAIGFLPFFTVTGLNLTYMVLCLKAFMIIFVITFFITLLDYSTSKDYIFTLQFYEDRLVYVNHQETKQEVLYVNIDKLSWRYNGQIVVTEKYKQSHRLYYPLASKPQSLAIRNLLEAVVQHNAMLKQ